MKKNEKKMKKGVLVSRGARTHDHAVKSGALCLLS